MIPQRRSDLTERQLADEIVIYNLATDQVTALDEDTSAVWRLIDGHRSSSDIADAAGLPANEVDQILDRIGEAGLLRHYVPPMARRRLLRNVGVAAAAPRSW